MGAILGLATALAVVCWDGGEPVYFHEINPDWIEGWKGLMFEPRDQEEMIYKFHAAAYLCMVPISTLKQYPEFRKCARVIQHPKGTFKDHPRPRRRLHDLECEQLHPGFNYEEPERR